MPLSISCFCVCHYHVCDCSAVRDDWDASSCTPSLELEQANLQRQADYLEPPRFGDQGLFTVNSSTQAFQHTWRVDLQAFQAGEYKEACGCGMTSSRWSMCRHFRRCSMYVFITCELCTCIHAKMKMHPCSVLGAAKQEWRAWQKPWLLPAAWEAQVGDLLGHISTHEIFDAALELKAGNKLLELKQPTLQARESHAAQCMV